METHKAITQTILKQPYERVLIPEEEGGFSAYIPEFEGCIAQGETADEALTALHDTAISWLEAELEAGKDIPEPWNLQEFSGKLLLRLPKSLHQQLARLANKEGVSLNQYLVSKLSTISREDSLLAALERRLNEVWPVKRMSSLGAIMSYTGLIHAGNFPVASTATGASGGRAGMSSPQVRSMIIDERAWSVSWSK